jgi:hypothetical protein
MTTPGKVRIAGRANRQRRRPYSGGLNSGEESH